MARRRSRKQDEDGGGGNFDLLFLQLMMVMLAFFILLSSLATVVDHKRRQALGSVTGALNTFFPSGGNISKGKGPALPMPGIGDSGSAAKRTAKDLTEVSKLLGMGDATHVLPLDKETVRVRLPEHILFHKGGVQLASAMNPFLDIMADILRRPAVVGITIRGYTDESPVHGSRFASNWELSAARAMQVFLALAKRGVPKGRMVVAGMGGEHPLPESQTHGDQSLNRRVDILLHFRPVTDQGEEDVLGSPVHGNDSASPTLAPKGH